MRSKTLFWVVLVTSLISFSIAPLFAVHEDAGTTGFNSLKIVYSARANAMGKAMTSIVMNPDGTQFNPSTILNLQNREVNSTYMNYFVDAQGGALQFMLPKDKYTAYGFFMNYLNLGTMDRTEADQQGNYVDTGETFGSYNLIVGASMAKHLNDAIDAGASFKIIYDKIDDSDAAAVMIDAGILHHPENDKIKVGLSMRNLGVQILHYSDNDYEEGLPLTFALGLSYDINDRSIVAFDLEKGTGEQFVGKFGYEFDLYPSLALRAGFRTDAEDWRTGGTWEMLSGLSTGMGWKWNQYNLDYSISSYGDLGFINQVSIRYEF
jgi:hypothetical protein